MSGSTHASSRSSDAALLEVLRVDGAVEVGTLATALGVTATAVRQRLERLMKAGLVERSAHERATGRGRPAHRYSLTEKGRRSGGDNFRDLALVLWREVRGIREPDVRRGLLARLGSAMANTYKDRVSGPTPEARLHDVASLFSERRLSCSVDADGVAGGLPVLTTYACPYPDLAEEDRGICAAERVMLEELVGAPVKLSECRLDGSSCCRFTAGEPVPAAASPALENAGVAASNAVRFPSQTIQESAP
ncbi:MAG: winged helix-turn-helix transcriptional regulator [Planctomycetia bacterium]